VQYGVVALVELALLVYCVLNIVTTPATEVRNLPKLLWLLLVVVVPIVGGIAWLVAGRPQGPARSVPSTGGPGLPPRDPRPGRGVSRAPDDDPEFLRRLQERAEQQRRAERERRAREGEQP